MWSCVSVINVFGVEAIKQESERGILNKRGLWVAQTQRHCLFVIVV